jgi:hypothetical protein
MNHQQGLTVGLMHPVTGFGSQHPFQAADMGFADPMPAVIGSHMAVDIERGQSRRLLFGAAAKGV